jgi:RHS repeat-associated protein
VARTNEWDAEDRLIAVTTGNQRTEFTYDGYGRRVGIRQLVNGAEVSHRRFVWCESEVCEERNANGTLVKRFFPEGVKIETGPVTGTFYYTRDHLGSIRELTDSSGNVRARYAYDPYGRRTKLAGDVDSDFGFAGMFWSPEVNLSLTLYRAYDAELGRWLSRDPLGNAELAQGSNLYAYVANDPVNLIDPLGLFGGEIIEVLGGEIVEVPGLWGELVEMGTPDYWKTLKPGAHRWNELYKRGIISQWEWMEKLDEKSPVRRYWYKTRLRTSKPYLLPARVTGPSGTFGGFVGMGLTVLTMANCDVAEGISALMRVRRGELANKYENEMMKQLQKDLP